MNARAAVLALLLAGWGEAAAQAQVGQVWVNKTWVYDQTSATAVALKPPAASACLFRFDCPYAFSARVNGTALETLSPPTLSGPINTGTLGSRWNGGVLGFQAPNQW